MQVGLFKEISNYTDSDGVEKTATNFYVQCGDAKVPIEVKYFKNKETGKDSSFLGRKMVLSSYAEEVKIKKSTTDKADQVQVG